MEDVVTVDYLLDLFQRLHDTGKGNMKIKCTDNFLHIDEIGINYIKNEIKFYGCLHNFSITQKVQEFCKDIEKAKNKFYGFAYEYEDVEEDI